MRFYHWLIGLVLAVAVPTLVYGLMLGPIFFDVVKSSLLPPPTDFQYHDSYFVVVHFQFFILLALLTFLLYIVGTFLIGRRRRKAATVRPTSR
ncbi:putative membrane protein [Paenibacillus phyllosphaerae]|uniref:Putative membrane protein n=1 Tax=Paenibacillus phyllosphaerae TaxID=274593 RepID=A0A7W5FR59_9BACL|nr:hypothetical protein [Paenibacillus phyllosphaerae]MBB3113714.1 putative membrane protein [Paenibacillus phyllosphaerae]